jgi:signal peptidase I
MVKDMETKSKSRAAEIANTFEWLITAFALAFVFRAFVMEAFRIPTGSMAETLMGAHYAMRCTECGYKYNYGQNIYLPMRSRGPTRQEYSRCPSCGYHQVTAGDMAPSSGDRILVLKCIYQFMEPKQFDVVVFKNPLDPTENYIKRLVGRPGETVEIIDGDVYINGQISRKPPKVQEELWMPVYDNDYQPARPEEPAFNGHKWRQPFWNPEGTKWKVNEANPTLFVLNGDPNETSTLVYDTTRGNEFKATYAYDELFDYKNMPYASDLMIRFEADPCGAEGFVGASLSKYGIQYRGEVTFAGQMTIKRVAGDKEEVLATEAVISPEVNSHKMFKFANVDHQLVLEYGKQKLVKDLGRGPQDAGARTINIEPKAMILGGGDVTISHIALFRDIHYTGFNPSNNSQGRATEGNPLKLEADQFFMLGDNSPRSEDGRWWARPGKGNNGKVYATGIVPRDYLVGKALFVYWPAGFKPMPQFPLAIVPNIGEIRFIYGGSDKR